METLEILKRFYSASTMGGLEYHQRYKEGQKSIKDDERVVLHILHGMLDWCLNVFEKTVAKHLFAEIAETTQLSKNKLSAHSSAWSQYAPNVKAYCASIFDSWTNRGTEETRTRVFLTSTLQVTKRGFIFIYLFYIQMKRGNMEVGQLIAIEKALSG